MIKHIVIHKYDDKEYAKEMAKALQSLEDLPMVKNLSVKLSEGMSSDSEYVLMIDFENLQDLEEYRTHPRHMAVADKIKIKRTQRSCVDYSY